MKRFTVLLTAVVTTVTLAAQTVDVAPATPSAQLLQSMVLSDATAARSDVRNVYSPAGYRLLWTRNGRPTAQATALISMFESAETKGLRSTDYGAGQWTARVSDLTSEAAQARFDYAMTATLVRYANDLGAGRANPQGKNASLYVPELVNRVATGDAANVISSVEPQTAEYSRLVLALATYRRLATLDTETLPVVNKLSKGDDYTALPQLAAKLRLYGDLASDAKVEGTKYDGAIVDAVKHFQSRHGLDNDGIIAKGTFAALNRPASQRVQQIELALERLRWTPAVEAPAIIVNIPEFKLRAIGETELEMRVVVGKAAGSRTPVFDGDLKHVVFRPYWNVPPSIQRNEIAPKLSSAYAAKHNYEVVDGAGRVQNIDEDTVSKVRKGVYQVRQKPGTSNALGLVKFLFPNDNNVYLHSTPQQSLFARARRDFSHGCVRVEDPEALAAFVLGWTPENVRAAMNGKRDDNYVKLAQPVNVRILYATAVARANGEVHFFDDIYGHDVELAKVL